MPEKNLYILTYDHGGFVLWGDKVESQLDQAIEWLENYPKFKIGLDYESFTYDEYAEKYPELNAKIAGALKKFPGRFGIGSSTYGQPLSLFISEESNARQLVYAIRSNLKHFGQTPPVYSISEHALHNQLPQLLKLCGYQAAIMRTHVMAYGYAKTFDAAWGLWVGDDGTGLPAVPTYDGEGEGFFVTTLDNWILTRWPGESEYSLEDFKEKFKKYSPLLASRVDDLTLRKEELVAHVEKKDDMQFVLLEEIPELYGEPETMLRTTANDFHGRMPWGYCGNEIFDGCRKAEVSVTLAERANALSVMLGGASEQTALETAWKNVLVAQHHDVTICGLLEYAHRFIPDSLKASEAAAERSMDYIASRFKTPEGEGVLAVNFHSFPVREWLEADVGENGSDIRVLDGERELPCEVVGTRVRFAADLAPLTAHRFNIKNDKPATVSHCPYTWDEASGVLKSPLYSIALNEAGIVWIDDAATGKRLVDNGEGALFCAWIEDVDCASSGRWMVSLFPSSACAVQEGQIGGIPFRFELRLYDGMARIECSVRFEFNGEHIGRAGLDADLGEEQVRIVNGFIHEEKLRFVLNACLNKNRRMVRDLPYMIADWDGSLVRPNAFWYKGRYNPADLPAGDAPFETPTYLQGNYWTCLRDNTRGVALFNRGAMGTVVEGNRLSLPLAYSNVYIQGTHILHGTYCEEFALFPFDAGLSDADLHRSALAYAYPAFVRPLSRGNGDLGDTLEIAAQNAGGSAVLTALYPENGAVFARWCNYSPNPASLSFAPFSGRVTAETDLLGNTIAKTDGKDLTLHGWEIKTLKIEK